MSDLIMRDMLRRVLHARPVIDETVVALVCRFPHDSMLTLHVIAVTLRARRQTAAIFLRAALVISSAVLFALQNKRLLTESALVTQVTMRLKIWHVLNAIT